MKRSSSIILFWFGLAALIYILLGLLIAPMAKAESAPGDFQLLSPLSQFHKWNVLNDGSDDDWNDDWDEEWDTDRSEPYVRYNRVEGLHIGVELKREYWKLEYPDQAFIFGSCGYAFAAKEFQYQLGLEKGLMEDFRMAFGAEYHRLIDTPDLWRMEHVENSLAAFLLREDFLDFYLREGGSAYYEQYFTRNVHFQIGYHFDQVDSIGKNTNWALFGGKKKFRDNPAMIPGDIKSIKASLFVDTRNSKKQPRRGWLIHVEGEHSLEQDNYFDFNSVVADIRRYQPLGYGESLDFRVRAGSGTGDLPWQRSFHLGGISTLRGFRYKAFPDGPMHMGGNRMLLGQVEFRIGSSTMQDVLDLDLFELKHIVLFADAGWVSQVDPELTLTEGFDEIDWSAFKSDVGIALTNGSGNIRFEIARRTDTSKKPFTFMIRMKRDF
jgi:hypothetical protein